ncbi:MAG: sugar ABC transporter substrate-binding protein [Ardenticatenales bacterium]|nr:sugar ABC transporter substrate-binding protein [Ardenticatenales bacterium]
MPKNSNVYAVSQLPRRLLTGILASLLLLILLTGCGTDDVQVVSFRTSGDPAEEAAYQTLVDAFHEAHPEIRIEFSHIASAREYRTRLVTDFAAGAAPDISLMNYRRFASFAASGVLEPVGPYLDQSDLISMADFYPVATEAFLWHDELMCLPQNISSLVVYYNQDLFDAAGVAYPPDRWTWAEFLETAQALTQDTNGDGQTDQFGLGVEPSLYRLSAFVWQNGGPLVDDLDQPSRLTVTRFPSLKAMEWFVALQTEHHVVPNRVEEASLDSESRFVAGQTAMFLDSRRGTPTYREIESFVWDVAPLPQAVEPAGILHSDAYCLASTTENKEAAWTFIEFANSVEGQTIIASTGRTVPSLIEVAESDAFLHDGQLPSRSNVWLDGVDYLKRVPVISTWEEVESVASEELERAFYGDISVDEAARLMVQRTEEYFLVAVYARDEE